MQIIPQILILTLISLLPHMSFAQVFAPVDFKTFVALITNLIGILITFIFALTFLVFVWGVVKSWILKGGDTEGVESGKKLVFTGIIVLVIMCTIWGILQILKSSLFGQ
jgi:uncharacterized membrane protein YdbT with pleckstrin-like domain